MTNELVLTHSPRLGLVRYSVWVNGLKHSSVEQVIDLMVKLGLEPQLRLHRSIRDDVKPFPVLLFYEGQGDPPEELDQKCKALDDALYASGDGGCLVMQNGSGFYEETEARKSRAKQKAVAA